MDKTPIHWQAFEYMHREKSSDWFWAVGIISAAGAATAVIFNDILFAVLIVVGTFALCLYAARRPVRVNFEINEKGIIVEKTQYPYTSLESFWVEENIGTPKVLIKSNKVMMPFIILPIEEAGADHIREYLSEHLPQEEHNEPLLHHVMEYLGF